MRRHHLLRRSPVCHGLHTADEAAFFDQQFAGAVGGEGLGHGEESHAFSLWAGAFGLQLDSVLARWSAAR